MRPLDTLDLHRRYLAGEPIQRLAKSVGFSGTGLMHRFKRDGLSLERAGCHRIPTNVADLVARYTAGESILALSLATGVSRPTVVRRLIAAGCTIRDGSEANTIRMAKMTPESRMSLTKNAHAAVRGVAQSEEQRYKVASTIEAIGRVVSVYEAKLAEMLAARGVVVVPQKAVGRYNVDLAIAESRIAVEIFGGNWHAGGKHARRFRPRLDYLSDRGWHVVIVWCTKRNPLTDLAADQVIAIHERIRSGETIDRKEHVIRGDGYLAAVDQVNPHNGSVILGSHPGNSTRGPNGRFG